MAWKNHGGDIHVTVVTALQRYHTGSAPAAPAIASLALPIPPGKGALPHLLRQARLARKRAEACRRGTLFAHLREIKIRKTEGMARRHAMRTRLHRMP